VPRPASIRGGLPSEARSARRPAHHATQAEILVPASVEPRSQIPNPAQRVDGSAPLPRSDRPSITVDTPSARTAAKHGVTGLGFFQELLRVHFRFICPTINLHRVGDHCQGGRYEDPRIDSARIGSARDGRHPGVHEQRLQEQPA
jgi:hypothetical protein